MGLFDFFKRGKQSAEMEAYLAANRPRVQYYLFAHRALREFAFEQPMFAFGGVLSDELRDRTGRALWDSIAEQIKETSEPTEPFPGMESRISKCGVFPCAIVKMPTPLKQTEAHFVAIVLRVDTSKDDPQQPVPVSYFTLEHGGPGGGTVLGEWTKDGRHIHHGEGPPPEWDAFEQAVARRLATGPNGGTFA
jgi:hypothetical protein